MSCLCTTIIKFCRLCTDEQFYIFKTQTGCMVLKWLFVLLCYKSWNLNTEGVRTGVALKSKPSPKRELIKQGLNWTAH